MIDRKKYAKAEREREVTTRSELLNIPGHHSVGSIITTFDEADTWSCSITISDCDRKITLTTDCGNESDWANAMFKVDTLIDVLRDQQKAIRRFGRKRGWRL